MPHVRNKPTVAEIRAELQAVLASDAFRRAPALSSFVSFVCEETLRGRSERLKEYTIAVEALGRPSDFQPSENPIVRVQAARLRQCLKEYYKGEGDTHAVQIRMPKGQYVPEFRLMPVEEETPQVPATQEIQPEPHAPLPAQRRRNGLLLAACALLVIGGGAVALGVYAPRKSASVTGPSGLQALPPGTSDVDTVRVLPGYQTPEYIDQLARTWSGDRYFSGGRAEQATHEPLVRAEDPNLWAHYRQGQEFSYDIPLKPGPHELHLHFAEPVFGADSLAGGGETTRIFDVFANGRPLLEFFDILREAGDPKVAVEKVFGDITAGTDGVLHLRFVARSSEAIVSGIEIFPSVPHRLLPIRVTTRNVPYVSPNGIVWQPDRFYSGGRTHPVAQAVTGTSDSALYSNERIGNFSYTFPVTPGSYKAVLHFSENYHGPSNPGGGGVGSRLFDVNFNGVVLLKDFDIFKEAGGSNRALRKEFRGLKPDALGKLIFAFQPIRNYPSVNAIEIIPE